MKIVELLPERREVDFAEWLQARRTQRKALLAPFQREVVDFCATLSQLLFRDSAARQHPELQALAYWMRRAELSRLSAAQPAEGPVLRMPRGLVFHIPPSNVPTIFVYSWVLSLLSGNRNIIRHSRRESAQGAILLRLISQALAGAPREIADSSTMVEYGHEPEITAALSQLCDLRVVWGGDHTVDEIRKAPLAPHARDLTFPDRYSLCALQAASVATLDDDALGNLAQQFYNDTFLFDQMACSSPRLLVWCGPQDVCDQAASRFLPALEEQIEGKNYDAGPAAKMAKFNFGCRAVLDGHANRYREHGTLAVLTGTDMSSLPRDHSGGGLLYEFQVPKLTDIEPFVSRREQTLTHFGFRRDELLQLAQELNGTGIDRMVPVGQALQFQRNWDGYDLLREMTREVFVNC